jgi:hypothetical protein
MRTLPHHFIAIAALACCALPAAAQIYKCPDATGKTVIQQMPCTGGVEMNVQPARGAANAADTASASAQVDKIRRDNDMAEAIRTHVPLVGMTSAQLNQAMGTPDKVNAANYNGLRKDQLIYYRNDATWYVYTANDVVESIQRNAPTTAMQPKAQVRCATSAEIRSAEVSASSMTLTPAERTERLRQIADMRACRQR